MSSTTTQSGNCTVAPAAFWFIHWTWTTHSTTPYSRVNSTLVLSYLPYPSTIYVLQQTPSTTTMSLHHLPPSNIPIPIASTDAYWTQMTRLVHDPATLKIEGYKMEAFNEMEISAMKRCGNCNGLFAFFPFGYWNPGSAVTNGFWWFGFS